MCFLLLTLLICEPLPADVQLEDLDPYHVQILTSLVDANEYRSFWANIEHFYEDNKETPLSGKGPALAGYGLPPTYSLLKDFLTQPLPLNRRKV